MWMRLYLDTNAVHLLRRKWKPAEFDQRGATKGVVLALGAHVIYELGRGFLRGRGASEVRATCEFLSEIRNVEFLPKLAIWSAQELTQAELGVPIVTCSVTSQSECQPPGAVATRLRLRRADRYVYRATRSERRCRQPAHRRKKPENSSPSQKEVRFRGLPARDVAVRAGDPWWSRTALQCQSVAASALERYGSLIGLSYTHNLATNSPVVPGMGCGPQGDDTWQAG